MAEIFIKLFNMSISASWLVLAVLVLRVILQRAPKTVWCVLWGLVAVRLLCPFSIESIFSLIPSAETIPQDIVQNIYLYASPHILYNVSISQKKGIVYCFLNEKRHPEGCLSGADDRGRTDTDFTPLDFESSASANSTTSAFWNRKYIIINQYKSQPLFTILGKKIENQWGIVYNVNIIFIWG